LSLSYGHKNMWHGTQVCFSVPPFYTPCTALDWPIIWQCWTNITSLTLSSVNPSWICPTIKESNSFTIKKCFLQVKKKKTILD
jgi:hypothetical protein